MHTRLVEKSDGSFNLEWSEDQGETWNHEIHRKLWVKKLAISFAKSNYPKAKYIGVVKAS